MCHVPDNYYPSGSKASNLSDKEDALAENEDEDEDKEMEAVVIQEGWVVQGVQYLDNHRQGVQTIESSVLVPKPRMLDKQQDKDVEVTIHHGNHFPSGLINASSENHDDPFAIAAILREKPGEIGHIAQMVCFVVTTLHSLASLTTSWCEFLLEVFIVLFNAMGHKDIVKEIPYHFPTAKTYAGLPTSNISILTVCPTCGDVFPVSLGTLQECPRCLIPLFKGLMSPPKQPIPPAT